MRNLLHTSGYLQSVDVTNLQAVQNILMEGEHPTSYVEHEVCVQQVTHIINDLLENTSIHGRTGRLWVEYIKQVSMQIGLYISMQLVK